jgi:hypothetical protein
VLGFWSIALFAVWGLLLFRTNLYRQGVAVMRPLSIRNVRSGFVADSLMRWAPIDRHMTACSGGAHHLHRDLLVVTRVNKSRR